MLASELGELPEAPAWGTRVFFQGSLQEVEEQEVPSAYSWGTYITHSPVNTLEGISDRKPEGGTWEAATLWPCLRTPWFCCPCCQINHSGAQLSFHYFLTTHPPWLLTANASLSLTTSLYPQLLPNLTVHQSPNHPVFPTHEKVESLTPAAIFSN
jgi:hypothetical protein